jgi:iron complex outermembrane receptor protein
MFTRPPCRHVLTQSGLCLALIQCGVVGAQSLSDVVVSASRSEQKAMDTAASVNLVNRDQIQDGQAQANLSEALARVPGLYALNRQNYAQDLQISSRGFGANSTFGARGIRIIVDGIPATVADGQGQISHIDLASADHIEVLRGPFSVLYGNASGGVINVFSERGRPGNEISTYGESGSYGLHKYGVKASGEQGPVNYLLDVGRLETQGYRQHSAASRENANAKLLLTLSNGAQLQLVANSVSLLAQDPLGLTAAQVQQNRTQPGNFALAYNTRKSVTQTQGGMVLTQKIDSSNTLVITPYYGERRTTQFLAGSSVTGSAAANNGVINLARTFYGLDMRWLHNEVLQGMPFQWVAGLDADRNNDHRVTSNNLAGQGLAPVATNQDLSQFASNLDAYFQAEMRPSERSSLTAGLRHSDVRLGSVSNNSQPGQGASQYAATTGLLSAQYYLRDDTNVYLSYGTGFDTPTLNQVAYSPASLQNSAVANTGNFGLQAARTHQWELGLKSEPWPGARLQAALFNASTRNDIVVGASNAGRSAFVNAPSTSRKGFEFSAALALPWQLSLNTAWSWLNATVDTPYTSYSGTVPQIIRAGSRIPGVPGRNLYSELRWQRIDRSFEAALEARAVGNMAASDANTAFAPGYGVFNARVVARQQSGDWSLSEFLRVDNIGNRAYVGSVIVNQASGQFYEPAPGRNWVMGLKAVLKF